MSTHKVRRRAVGFGAAVALLAVLPQGRAAAHPLGNFSVSHLNTLTIRPDALVDDVVIDAAEIPTAQSFGDVDTDGDGSASSAERQGHADDECDLVRSEIGATADGAPLSFTVARASLRFEPGQAGLETSRLECRLVAPFPDGLPERLAFSDDYRPGRVGWHEINAVGDGVDLVDPAVPATSVTDGLRVYPDELLQSPLDVRRVELRVAALGSTVTGSSGIDRETNRPTADTAGQARDSLVASRPGFLGSAVERVQNTFDDMIGRDDLTLGVGLLAISLSLVLGASHALLPGHGKTVMAAYVAGRQGSARDAMLVGVTVTATHTGGVLLLGFGLSVSTALAGETVLAWLGVASGLMIAGLGLALLISGGRNRESTLFSAGHHHGFGGHTHGPGGHTHAPVDRHSAPASSAQRSEHGVMAVGATMILLDDDHVHGHDHHDDHDHDHHDHADDHGHDHHHGHDHDHGHEHEFAHAHDHDRHHDSDHRRPPVAPVSRRGLVGMGVAGGLVPSPSALVVLLSAIALGRTWFGVVLVVGYGAGMAIVLTLAGLLLVQVRDRYQDSRIARHGRLTRSARTWSQVAPFLTAALVVVVGAGLALRSVSAL